MASQHSNDLRELAENIDKLSRKISSMQPSSIQQLEEWRQAAYHAVDNYCDSVRHELIETKQSHQKKELDHLRQKLNRLIERQDDRKDHYDSLNHDIQLIEVKINEIEHLRLTVHPLSIDEHLITRRHLFPLSHALRTLHLKAGLESAVGTNERHLLVDREGKHLCLLDRDLKVVKEVPFTHDGIHGICWASAIARFIIITFKEILLLDEKTMALEKSPIAPKGDWWRGTCSDDILFLSTVEWGSSIYEFNIRSSFKAIKELHAPATCTNEEIICDIKYNSGFIAMPVFNKHREESRFELRSAKTFDCIWSVRVHGRCRCCSIDVDQWLLMDHDDCRFFHIAADGKLLEADKYDQHERLEDIIPWGKDHVVILTTKSINLHKLD